MRAAVDSFCMSFADPPVTILGAGMEGAIATLRVVRGDSGGLGVVAKEGNQTTT